MTLRAGLSGRVSDDKGGRSASVAEQIAAGEKDAASQGWQVADRFADSDISASRFANGKDRPQWQRLQRAIESGALDVVTLWTPSRGSRELVDWAGFLARCRRHRVLIRIITHGPRTYDLSVARDWKTLAEDGIDSAFESDQKSEAITRGVHGAMAAGKPLGGATHFGYVKVRDPDNGKVIRMETVPERAAIIAELFALADAGTSVTAAARACGVTRQNARNWLRNPFYAGLRILPDGSQVEGTWAAIIEPEQFWRVQNRLAGHLHAGERRPGLYRSMLSYIATCGVCGRAITTEAGRDRYRCVRGCVTYSPVAEADQTVTTALLQILYAEGWAEKYLDAGDGQNAAGAHAEAAQLRQRLEEASRSYALGRLDIGGLEEIRRTLRPLIAAAEDRARRASVPAALAPFLPDPADETPDGFTEEELGWAWPRGNPQRQADIRRILGRLPLGGQRDLLRALATVKIHKGRRIEVTPLE